MDIVFVLMLFVFAIIFTVIMWLPNFGTMNLMFFSVFGMGAWFILVMLMFNVTTIAPQPYMNSSSISNYPVNNISLQYPTNSDILNDSPGGWIQYTFTDSWLLGTFFLGLGLASALRFAFLTMAFLREIGEGRDIKI